MRYFLVCALFFFPASFAFGQSEYLKNLKVRATGQFQSDWYKLKGELMELAEEFEAELGVTYRDMPHSVSRIREMEIRLQLIEEEAVLKKDLKLKEAVQALKKRWQSRTEPMEKKFRKFEFARQIKPRPGQTFGERLYVFRAKMYMADSVKMLKGIRD